MKRVLYISRKKPNQCEINALKTMFGPDVLIDHWYPQQFPRPKDIVNKRKSGKYDDLVVGDPLILVYNLCSLGCYPLCPYLTKVKYNHEIDYYSPKGRGYKFKEFGRVNNPVLLEFED